MMNGTARPQARTRGQNMTMRVYAVDRYGTITQDRGTVTVTPGNQPLPLSTAYPPCSCPRHRSGQAVRP
ncbi:hypothetical protein D9753_02315 [Streptomyces dangxiongensis]|uniref:Uncharacterized protein n=1 Tax=Streptomyces dangxiongensis TaxID=1442032 RepID=A0A3G2J6Y5_9ACTN|nr:hypothetical protein [Streptomyces dangxiongensis]AYN37980.1 hypothetical protein D9753_02315 [Streptomyces dangxiongensis]